MRCALLCLVAFSFLSVTAHTASNDSTFFRANHPAISYTGRIDFSDPAKPRFWMPGVYITIRFTGTYCILQINDEVLWNKSHNYIEVKIDDRPAYRIQTTGKENRIVLAQELKEGKHTAVICKNTEAGIGYLELVGFVCRRLIAPPKKPSRKIEFIGNSITCGMGLDPSSVACNKGEWYDQSNAYMAYGPQLARKLSAQWQLSSVSGIGLIHSCCNKTTVMPEVFDKINMSENKLPWDFSRYQPDIVTVCLGQNDGIQDSTAFCSAYTTFLQRLRGYYPNAKLLLMTSPMGGPELDAVLKKYIDAISKAAHLRGDKNVSTYFFSQRFYKGCDAHPNMEEHTQMAAELGRHIKKLMHW